MDQICISSDVTSDFIIENYIVLNKFRLFDSNFRTLETSLFCKIENSDIDFLINNSSQIIDQLIRERNHKVKRKTKVIYKGDILELDLQKDVDFSISMLVDLYDMSCTAKKFSGTVYICNRDILKRNKGDKIIAYLRHRFDCPDALALKKGIEYSSINLGDSENNIDVQDFNQALGTLKNHGLIFIKEDRTIHLTPRGYLFW